MTSKTYKTSRTGLTRHKGLRGHKGLTRPTLKKDIIAI